MDFRAVPAEVWALVALAAMAFAAIVVVFAAARTWMRRARMRARSSRAMSGERGAVAILRAHGYAIVGAQVAAEYPVEVDGETFFIGLRADYIVSKAGARYVAEVKTGAVAPRIDTAATRRQILEYDVAFGVDGVLLVDAEEKRVHEIAFPTLATRASRSRRKVAV